MNDSEKSRALVVSVVMAVGLHVGLAALLVLPAVQDLLKPKYEPEEVELEADPEIVFRFQAKPKTVSQAPETVNKEKAEPPKRKRFARTSAEQEQGVAENADRIGDRDTVARSDAAARADAPDRAAVRGEKREDDETTNSSKQDGNLEHEAIAGQPSKSIDAPESAIPPVPEELAKPREAQPEVAKGPEKRELMDLPDKVEVTESAEERAERMRLGERMKRDREMEEAREREMAKREAERKEREAREEAERKKRMAANQRSRPGFKPNVGAAETMGSLRRRGKASQNVKATPTGRYTSEVIKRVGREWYRRCSEKADLLVPGSLTMGWFVYEDGSVKHLEIKGERNGGMIQRGITIQSIKAAKAPPMPATVRDELKGDPLYIQINFEF